MLIRILKQSGLKIATFTVLFSLSLLLYGAVTINTVPNTFVSKTALKASEMNANFTALYNNDLALKTAVEALQGTTWSTNAGNLYYTGGNVGIGTTTPSRAKLELNGNINGNFAIFGGDTYGFSFNAGSGYTQIGFNAYSTISGEAYLGAGYGGQIFVAPTGGMGFNVSAVAGSANQSLGTTMILPLWLSKTGNVGIGTTGPQTRLHVIENAAANYAMSIENTFTNGYGLLVRSGAYDTSGYALALRPTAGSDTGPLFEVRNDGNVFVKGNAGIGTSNPQKKLHVVGEAGLQGNQNAIHWIDTGGTTRFITGLRDDIDGSLNFVFYSSAGGKWRFRNTDVMIDALASNGPVYSNGTILTNTNPSSMTYKTEIKNADLQAERLLLLTPKTFIWKNNGQSDFGLIAEEVKEILPELYQDDGKIKGFKIDKLPFYMIELLKKHENTIKELKSENAELKKEIAEIKKHLGMNK